VFEIADIGQTEHCRFDIQCIPNTNVCSVPKLFYSYPRSAGVCFFVIIYTMVVSKHFCAEYFQKVVKYFAPFLSFIHLSSQRYPRIWDASKSSKPTKWHTFKNLLIYGISTVNGSRSSPFYGHLGAKSFFSFPLVYTFNVIIIFVTYKLVSWKWRFCM